jgi:hypothetical protein
MNTKKERKSPPLAEVLEELMLAEAPLSADVLSEFTRRYPEYADALLEYAVELVAEAAFEESVPEQVSTPESAANAARAMSRFQNRIYELQQQGTSSPEAGVENPLATLDTATLRAVMKDLNVTPVFLMKLRDRRIREDTIPKPFTDRLARGIKVSPEKLRKRLAAPSELRQASSWKSDKKPEAPPKETFEEAIVSSNLTAEQQAALRTMCS